MVEKLRVFLGGTTNDSYWRNDLIVLLDSDYFDPVVSDWTEECKAEELKQRVECDFVLYGITPKMLGFYSIAEVVDDSNKRPGSTILLIINVDGREFFNDDQMRSMKALAEMVEANGAKVFYNVNSCAEYLNSRDTEHEFGLEERKDKKWSDKVTKKARYHPPKGLFAEGTSKAIADEMIKASSSRKQAVSRVEFYMNRAGSNLSDSDKRRLQHAIKLIEAHYDNLERQTSKNKTTSKASSKW